MTRKDYIAIAAAIRATQERIKAEHEAALKERRVQYRDDFQPSQQSAMVAAMTQQLRGVRRTAAHLADALKEDNPRGFDPVLFLRNCGYGVDRGFEKMADSEERSASQLVSEPPLCGL